jgi:hypothetical protein
LAHQEPLPLGFGQIGFLELRWNPLGGHAAALFLWLLISVRNLLGGYSEERPSGAARKLQSARKTKQWCWRKNKELVKQ